MHSINDDAVTIVRIVWIFLRLGDIPLIFLGELLSSMQMLSSPMTSFKQSIANVTQYIHVK